MNKYVYPYINGACDLSKIEGEALSIRFLSDQTWIVADPKKVKGLNPDYIVDEFPVPKEKKFYDFVFEGLD